MKCLHEHACVLKKIEIDDSFLCVDNIVPLLEEAWLFPGLLQHQRNEAASREDNC